MKKVLAIIGITLAAAAVIAAAVSVFLIYDKKYKKNYITVCED